MSIDKIIPSFTEKEMQKEAERLYFEANSLISRKEYEKAAQLYLQVIEISETPYLSGSYLNLAQSIWIPNPTNKEVREKALGYIEEALEVKPSNQPALFTGTQISLLLRKTETALNYFSKIKDKALIMDQFQQVNLFYTAFYNLFIENPKDFENNIKLIEDLFERDRYMFPQIGDLIVKTYSSMKEFKKAYFIMDNLLADCEFKPTIFISNCINFSFQGTANHNHPQEGIKYAEQGINKFKNQKSSFKKENKDLLEKLQSNLALGYVMNHQYEDAISLLKPQLNKNPNNTDYQNIAYAYNKLGKYDEALNNINKALFIFKDEIAWFLKADILYAKKQYDEALKYYLKAISFINEANTKVFFKEQNKEILFSSNLDMTKTRNDILTSLVNCYITLQQFPMAKALLIELRSEMPYEKEIIKLEQTVNLFMKYEMNEQDAKDKLQVLEEEINKQRNEHQNEFDKVQEWALKLLKLQNQNIVEETNQLVSEKNWRDLSKKMHQISLLMKAEKVQKVNYNKLKNSFKQIFPNISEEGLEFLTTGDYLLKIHSDSEIDFAPVVIEFSKVIEKELNNLLKRKGQKIKRELTLGQFKYNISGIDSINSSQILQFLNELIIYRNESAHTGKSTKEKVERIRRLIVDDGWLNLILKS